jgi:hypothetical protein
MGGHTGIEIYTEFQLKLLRRGDRLAQFSFNSRRNTTKFITRNTMRVYYTSFYNFDF